MSLRTVVLGSLAWTVRFVRDPLGVSKFRGNPELRPEELPGMDPAVRPVGSVPAE